MKDPRLGLPSASSIELYYNCKGAFLLSKQVPEEERLKTEAAEIGTRIHEANEHSDATLLESYEERDILDMIRQREQEIYHRWCQEFDITDAEIIREKRLWLTESGVKRCSGKLDLLAISPTKRVCLILDSKSGRKAVAAAPRNWQLKTQAVLVAANYAVVRARVGIVQPLAKVQPLCEYEPDHLYGDAGAWDQLRALLAEINKPDAPRTPGEHCSRCDAKHICPEARGVITSLASLKGLVWAAIAPEKKLELWKQAKVAEALLGQIFSNVKSDVRYGRIPGLTLSSEQFPRVLTSVISTFQVLSAEMNDPEFQKRFDEDLASVSVGAIEEYVREKRGGTKKATTTWVNEKLKDHIKTTRREGHVMLLKETN